MKKKTNKKIISLLFVTMFMITISYVYADGISTDFPEQSGSIVVIDNSVQKIWGTVTLIVQILAVAAIVFAGLRYMYAPVDKKADIKKGLIMLVIGSLLVFTTPTIIKFIVEVATSFLS